MPVPNCKQLYLAQSSEDCVKSFTEVPVHKRGENLGHGGVIKGLDGDDIEVTHESSSDSVPSSSWGAHSAD